MRWLRNNLNFSQAHLAARAGLHRTYISDIERGLRNATLSTIAALADGLKVAPAELLAPPDGGEEPAPAIHRPVNARTPQWKKECLAAARESQEFTLFHMADADTAFIKEISAKFHYTVVPVGLAAVFIPIHSEPSAPPRRATPKPTSTVRRLASRRPQ